MPIGGNILYDLNASEKSGRIAALKAVAALHADGTLGRPEPVPYANNHIRTTYSFSPYSPSKAAYLAWVNGLSAAGIMDRDSLAGAEEFIEAGRIIGLATTVGFECRCSAAGTAFEEKILNDPGKGVMKLAIHGVPHGNIQIAQDFLAPFRKRRVRRIREMAENLNSILGRPELALDYDRDVLPLSQHREGGSVTGRHLLFALVLKILQSAGIGRPAVELLEDIGLAIDGPALKKLLDGQNRSGLYEYYLLEALENGFGERICVPATEELPHVTRFTQFAKELGGVASYGYLGDAKSPAAGDIKARSFEDACLNELFEYLKEAGFNAVTYRPKRNSPEQLARVAALCEKHGFLQLSCEDIGSPFRPFVCAALERPQFKHLIDNSWALIGHEEAATKNVGDGMFTEKTARALPGLAERITYFEAIGRRSVNQ